MLDVGLGEVIVIAIIALLVFGPDRLPKVASDAAKTMRQLRTMAVAARKELSDAAGFEKDEDLSQVVRDIRDLDPRRALSGLGDEVADGGAKGSSSSNASGARGKGAGATGARRGAAAGSTAGGAAAGTSSASGAVPAAAAGAAGIAGAGGAGATAAASVPAGESGPADGAAPEVDGELTAGPVLDAAPADPDWT